MGEEGLVWQGPEQEHEGQAEHHRAAPGERLRQQGEQQEEAESDQTDGRQGDRQPAYPVASPSEHGPIVARADASFTYHAGAMCPASPASSSGTVARTR